MLIASLLLLFLFNEALCHHFTLTGHWTGISHHHVRGIEKDHVSFKPHEERLFNRLKTDLQDELHEFFVNKFEIHGEKVEKPSAIFRAFLTSPLDREALIQKMISNGEVTVVYMLKIDDLPKRTPFIEKSKELDCHEYGIKLPNNTCACPPFYTGDECYGSCLNQGIYWVGKCACPPGFTGQHCEPQACTPATQQTFSSDQQQFVLVVNTKSTMAYPLNTLLLQMGDVLNKINATHPNLYNSWILVYYIETEHMASESAFVGQSQSDFLNALTGLHIQKGSEKQPTFFAINELLDAQTISVSNIFVFTDSLDDRAVSNNYTYSDESDENILALRHFMWRNKMMFFLSQPAGQPLDSSSDDYDEFRRMAQMLHSDVVSYDEREIDSIMSLMVEYTQHENIAVRYSVADGNSQQVALIGDSPDQNITVLVTVDPNGILPTVTSGGTTLKPTLQGKRFMMFQTTSQDTPSLQVNGSSSWSLRAFVHSKSTAFVSYNHDPEIDGDSYINLAELPTTLTAAQVNIQAEKMTYNWLDMQTGNATTDDIVASKRDVLCSFQYDLGNSPKKCTPGPYAQQVTFQTSGLTLGVRVLPGLCLHADQHEKPDPFFCLNNQTRVGNTCECDEFFEGPHCENVVCFNEGTVNQFPGNGQPFCFCRDGFQGEFCEIMSCDAESKDSFDVSKRTIALVLQSTFSQAWINDKISEGMSILLNDTVDDKFNQFVLTTFSSVMKNGEYNDVELSNSYSMAAAFQTALDGVRYTPSNADSQATLNAIMANVNEMKFTRSSIFLFVDSPFRITDTNQFDVMKKIVDLHHELNIVVTPPFGMADLCMSSENATAYFNLAKMTGGIFINLCNPYGGVYGDPIVELFTGYGDVHHHLETLDQADRDSSTQLIELQFKPFEKDVLHVIVNSDKTENFTLNYYNGDTNRNLDPILIMPFLSIYELQQNPQDLDGDYYKIAVQGGRSTADGSLFVRLAQKSTLSAFLSFSLNPSVDSGTRSVAYGVQFYPVVYLPGLNESQFAYEYYLTGVDVENIPIYFGGSSKREDSCVYDNIFTKIYTCDKIDDVVILKLSIPTGGAEITRSIRSFCYAGNQCLNGGTRVNATSCQCTENYRGDYCELPKCVNGYATDNFDCFCHSGYGGQFCEYVKCNELNFWEFKETRGSPPNQLIYALNTNIDQLAVNQQLATAMSLLLPLEMFIDDAIPTVFTLITFDEHSVNTVISTTDDREFAVFLANVGTTSTVGNNTLALDALQEAYFANIDYTAVVYIFTGSSPAPGPASLTSLLKKRSNTQVNVIYTPQNVVYPMLPPGPNGNLLLEVAKMSGGRFIPVAQSKISQMDNIITTTFHDNEILVDGGFEDCTAPKNITFYVEDNFIFLTLLITGFDVTKAGNVLLVDPNGNNIDAKKILYFKSNSFGLFRIDNSTATVNSGGQWTATVKVTTGSCLFQARVNSQISVIPAFTADLNNDYDLQLDPFSQFASFSPFGSYVSFRVADTRNGSFPASLQSLRISDTDPLKPWNDEMNQFLQMQPKDPNGCSFQWISSQFQMGNATRQKMELFGDDGYGKMFQRTFFFSLPQVEVDAINCYGHGSRTNLGNCVCQKGYSGEYCSDRVCQNGGTSTFGGVCACQNGYYGAFCEKYVKEEL